MQSGHPQPMVLATNPTVTATTSSQPSTSASAVVPVDDNQGPPRKLMRSRSEQSNLKQYFIKTSKSEKEQFDQEIANYIYATNTPFQAVEHPQCKRMITKLRPGYNPPNRKQVGGPLLEKAYADTLEEYSAHLKGKTVCLAIDGWSNIHNEPIVCASVTCDEKVYLVSTLDTHSKHTSENLLEITEASIEKCEKEYGCFVRSFVTDNAANMAKVRKELAKKDDTLIAYGCSAHLLNLLAQDLEIKEVKEHTTQIIKYFRNHHNPGCLYKKAGGKKLLLPAETRWNTMIDSIQSYLQNWEILVTVCKENNDDIDLQIARKVNDRALKRFAEDYLDRLKPISVALDKLQRDVALISDAVEVWHKLKTDLKDLLTDKKDVEKVDKRRNAAITPAHFLANLLDPRYRGRCLSSEEVSSAENYVEEYFPNFLPTLMSYRGKSTPFKEMYFKDNVIHTLSPLAWWQSFPELRENLLLPTQLYTAVASSAGLERVFSSFGLVQSKIRNRLGNEKASKLVTVFKHFNEKNTSLE